MSNNQPDAQPSLVDQGARILVEHASTPHEMHNMRARFECCARDVLALPAERIRAALWELEGGHDDRAVDMLNELVNELENLP